MANNNFDLPRPTDPVPSATSAVINDNAKVLDYYINSNSSVITRTGKILKPLSQILNELGVIYSDPIKDWSVSLLVDRVEAHRYPAGTGDIYAPIAPLPFTTGLTFNPANWAIIQGTGDLDGITVRPIKTDPVACNGVQTAFNVGGTVVYSNEFYTINLDGVEQSSKDEFGIARWSIASPGVCTFVTAPAAGSVFTSELYAPILTEENASEVKVFDSFAELINFTSTLSQFKICSTAQHTSNGVGAASYSKDGTTGSPNTGNEAKFYDGQGVGWKVNGVVELSMVGGVADGTTINNAALAIAAQASDMCLLDGKIGTYRFSGTPELPSTFSTLIFGQTAITGVTADKVNGRLLNRGVIAGIPYTPELGYSYVEFVAGTLRQNQANGAQWDWIKDGAHEPIGVDDTVPATASGSVLSINFLKTYTKVITFVAGPDEALANAIGFKCGASAGLSKAEIKASVCQVMSAQIWYNGSQWNWAFAPGQGGAGQHGTDISSIIFDTGNITIQHDDIKGTDVSLVPWTQEGTVNPYPIHLRSLSPTTRTIVTPRSWAGGYVLTPDTNMSFIYTKRFNGGIFMDGSNGSEVFEMYRGNIWFHGLFIV